MLEAIKQPFSTFSIMLSEYKVKERVQTACFRAFEALESAYLAVIAFARRVRTDCYNTIARAIALLVVPSLILYSPAEVADWNKKADQKIHDINSTTASVAQRVPLDGISLTHSRDKNPHRAHIIHFLSSSELWQQSLPLLEELHYETNMDVRCRNYRQSVKTEEELILDGVQAVKELIAMGIPQDKIVLSGYSFGGVIATLVKAWLTQEHISVHLSIDRTVSSFEEVMRKMRPLLSRLLVPLMRYYGWSLNVKEALQTLHDPIICVHNKDDTPSQKAISILLDDKEYAQEHPGESFTTHTRSFSKREKQQFYHALRSIIHN